MGPATGSNRAAGMYKRGARWRGRRQLFKPLLAPPGFRGGTKNSVPVAPHTARGRRKAQEAYCLGPAQFSPMKARRHSAPPAHAHSPPSVHAAAAGLMRPFSALSSAGPVRPIVAGCHSPPPTAHAHSPPPRAAELSV